MRVFLGDGIAQDAPVRGPGGWQVQMFVQVLEQDVMAGELTTRSRQEDMTTMMSVLGLQTLESLRMNVREHHPGIRNIQPRRRHRLGQTRTRTHSTRRDYQRPPVNMAVQVWYVA